MRSVRSWTLTAATAVTVAALPAAAQEYYYASEPAAQLFSAEELDNLVAPVALYPDPILAQLFVAATYPDQVDIAARHVRVFGTSGIDNQPWDVSVRAVAYYPPVLNMLADRTDWSTALGQAYAVQPEELMDAVQRLRWMAREHGNLISTNEQVVIVERRVVRIVPAHPRYIYVPVYRPEIIYYRPAGFYAHVRSGSWTFGIGFPIGAWLSYDCDWDRRRVYYDGWRGRGWRVASRPHVQNVNIFNIYINPRYEVVNINRTIVNRRVNHITLVNNSAVHQNVTFDAYPRRIAAVVESEKRNARALPTQRAAQPVVQQSSSPRVESIQRGAPVQRAGPAARSAPVAQRSTSAAQRPAPATQRSAPTVQRPAPAAQRSAPTAQRPAPATQRSAPTTQRSAPAAQRSAPTAQRSAPATQRSAPTTQRPAPATQRSAPSVQRPAPTAQRPAPTAQRSAPTTQRPARATQRSASPAQVRPPPQAAPSRSASPPPAAKSASASGAARSASTAGAARRPSKAKDKSGGK